MNRSLLRCAIAVAPLLLTANAVGQFSIIFNSQVDELHHDPLGLRMLGEADDDELEIVTPLPGMSYSGRSLLQRQVQWMLANDGDGDGEFVESTSNGPFLAIDAAFAKSMGAGQVVDPRDVFFSFTTTTEPIGAVTAKDGDVLRLASPGVAEMFVTEDQLVAAIGGTVGSDEIDTDAIARSQSGDLLVSFNVTETINGTSADDGAIVMIPSSAITYDSVGNVTSITAGTAMIIATELDVDGWVANANVASADGSPFTGITDLGGLEIDPAGGTFAAPASPGVTVPNLLFTSTSSSSDGAIFSTAGGGSIPMINSVPMASTVATTGTHIGLLPDASGVSGIGGLALVPAQMVPPRLAVNALEQDYSTSDPAYSLFEAQGMTPGGNVIFFLDLTGTSLSELTVPGFTGAAVTGAGVILPLPGVVANSEGFALADFYPPLSAVGSDLGVVVNALDVTSMSFAVPGVFQF